MAKFRTKKSDRTTYIYRDEHGKAITVLHPGADGVTEADIAMLHSMDDDEHNAAKKDSYYGTLHYDQIFNDGLLDNPQKDLADESANPETMLFAALEAAERSGEFKSIWDELQPRHRDLVMKKLLKRSNVDIAAEEGVTEAAIRNRLTKIQKKFEKFLR
jgi:DNA-directed RNA polymerase specialized sigma24 family protein